MATLVKRAPRFIRDARRRSAYSQPGATGWPGSLITPSIAGITVTPQTALSFTAYYAGIRVISEDTASLPIAVFRKKPKGGAKLIKDHPITWHFNRCPAGDSKEMPSMQWRESWISHVLGWGNGYAEIEWSKGGEFLGLNLLHPNGTTVKRDVDRKLYYEITSTGSVMRNQILKIAPEDMLHLAGLGFNGLVGYSPVALAREAIGLGKAAEQFGASLFGNGAIPKGMLKYPGRLRPEARANLRDSINSIHQGSPNANKIMILEEGLDWTNTQINPDDAQFLLTRSFQVVEIARILRLPPHKLGDMTNANYSNVEAMNLDYLMTCLRPWCIRIEQCIDLKLLSDEEIKAGFYTRHDIRAILRASIKDRAAYYQQMFQFGMSPDEIRELEDMNPIGDEEGGNKRFRPAAMIELTAEESEADSGAPDTPKADQTDPNNPPQLPGEPGRPEGSSLARRRNGAVLPSKNGRFYHENGVI